jgi:hypothetical protein
MKTITFFSLFFFMAVLSTACTKVNESVEVPKPMACAASFAANATGDTITLPDGSKAILVQVCHYDTIKISEAPPTDRPIVMTGSSSVVNWPDSSFTGYNVVKIGKGGYAFSDMRGTTTSRGLPINFDSLLALNPKEWIFQGGDNDVLYKRPLVSIQADAQYLISKIISKVPDIKVVFLYAKPTEPNQTVKYASGETGWAVTEYYNRNMALWGSKTYPRNFVALDTYGPYILWNPKRLNTALYKDVPRVHWNAAGYAIANKLLRPQLLK